MRATTWTTARISWGGLEQVLENDVRNCKQKEVRLRRMDSRCFEKARAKFEAVRGKATVFPGCRRDTPTGIILEMWEPPTPRCDQVPSGFNGTCFP